MPKGGQNAKLPGTHTRKRSENKNRGQHKAGVFPLEAPEWLTVDEVKVWDHYAPIMSPVWTDADIDVVSAYCQVAAKLRQGEGCDRDYTQLRQLANQLGLDPFSRSKMVPADSGKSDDPLAKLIAMPSKKTEVG